MSRLVFIFLRTGTKTSTARDDDEGITNPKEEEDSSLLSKKFKT